MRERAYAIWRSLRREKGAMIGLLLIVVVTLMALAAPLAPYGPTSRDKATGMAGPSGDHLLGTDSKTYDVFSRMLYGARTSLLTGVAAIALALLIGIPLGAASGYFRGWPDTIIMRFVDVMLAFPSIVLAIAIAAVLGKNVNSVIIAVGVVNIPIVARQVRGSVLQVREQDYVVAARSLGFGTPRILLRHVLPNCLAPIIVLSTLGVGFAILSAAGINFLGLGPEPRIAEWGVMLRDVTKYIRTGEWWIYVPPGAAIACTVLGFNLFGDGLRKALDPRSR